MKVSTWIINLLVLYIFLVSFYVLAFKKEGTVRPVCKLLKTGNGTPLLKRCLRDNKSLRHQRGFKFLLRQRRDADTGVASSATQNIASTSVIAPHMTRIPILPSPSSTQFPNVYPTITKSNGYPGPVGLNYNLLNLPGPPGTVIIPDGAILSKLSLVIVKPSDAKWIPHPFGGCNITHGPGQNCSPSNCPGNVTKWKVDFVNTEKEFIANISWSPPERVDLCTGYFLWWSHHKKGAPIEDMIRGTKCTKLKKDTFHYEIAKGTEGWNGEDKLLVLVKALPTSLDKQEAKEFYPKPKECFDPIPETPAHVYFNFTRKTGKLMTENSLARASCDEGYFLWESAQWLCVVTKYGEAYWKKDNEPLCLTKEEFIKKCNDDHKQAKLNDEGKMVCEVETKVVIAVVLGVALGVLLFAILAIVQYHRYTKKDSSYIAPDIVIKNYENHRVPLLDGHYWVVYHPDSQKFIDEVYRFTTYLREHGYNAVMDKMDTQRLQVGPAKWCEIQMAKSTKIIVMCSRGFLKMCDLDTSGKLFPENLSTEEKLSLNQISYIRQALFDSAGRNEKIIPVLTQNCCQKDLPPFLRTLVVYRWPDEQDSLLCAMVDSPEYET